MYPLNKPLRGRGASENLKNRFSASEYAKHDEAFPDAIWSDPEEPAPGTQFFKDESRSIIVHNSSPDVGMEASVNPYRGCEHGCIYCYARPTHEYRGLSAGLDFETKIFVKQNAPELLRKEFSSLKWKPKVVTMSGITDVYQPAERKFGLTRKCLEVFAEFRNPVVIITKNFLVTRDIDVLKKMAEFKATAVFISVTTLDPDLARVMEPRTSHPQKRLEAIRMFSDAGVPVGVNIAPVIPGLTDHELPSIISASSSAGAKYAGFVPLRLPYGVKDLFENWLEQHFPDRKEKVLNRIRSMRGGKLNDPCFNSRMSGEDIFAEQIAALFLAACRRAGFSGGPVLSTAAFRRGPDLFDQCGY